MLKNKENKTKKVKVKCPHCGYEWKYGGRKKVFCTCPDCMKRLKIDDYRVK